MEVREEYKKVAGLIAKEILGQADGEDRLVLKNWREAEPGNEEFYRYMTDPENFGRYVWKRKSVRTPDAWKRVESEIRPRRVPAFFRWGRYAAAAAALVVAGWLIWPQPLETPERQRTLAEKTEDTIGPGSARAVLLLSDGSRIDLPEDRQEKIEAGGMEIGKDEVKVKKSEAGERCWNKILIPRGGEYKLVLADGTTVYINSESELIFPTKFAGGRREVSLKGEAYFRVAKNASSPFVVKTERMDVVVTGTEFNLKAYTGEKRVQATLVEGKIEVRTEKDTCRLYPSQQAEWAAGAARTVVRNVDVTPFIAWKNGMFLFKADRLEDIMSVLQRWYDCEVVYEEENIKDIVFAGRLKRTETITPILDVIRSTRKISVEVKGKRIVFGRK